MPSAVYSSESGLESESLHNASCASSAHPQHPHPRGLFSLSAQQQRYSALQASMSSGDNFIQARNLSLGGGHGHGFMGGRVWSPFAGIAPGPGAGQGAHEVSPQAVMAEKELVAEEHDSNNEHGAGGFAEHDYMSDVSSAPADEKERSEVKGDDALDTDSNLNMRETELRLGPLGPPPSGEDGRLMQAGAKRGFSEAIGGLSESKRSLSDPTEAKRSFPEATNGSGNGSGAGEVGELRARNGSAGSTALGMKSPCFSDHGGLKECSDGRPSFPSLFSGFSAAKLGGAGDADGKLGNGKHPSGFRVPSLPPPWQALEQSAGSFGPFPSQKSPLEVPSPAKFIGEGGSMCGRDMSFSWENNRVPRSGGGDTTPTSGQCSAFASEGSTVESGRKAATPSSDAAASPASRSAPVVGWPPVRAVRKSSVPSPPPLKGGESHCVSPSTGKATLATPAVPRPALEGLPKAMRPSGEAGPRASSNPSPTAVSSNYCFVKVYMDGIPFGRKVDLRIHSCYEKLSVVLEEMFTRYVEQSATGDGKPLKLLQGSEYVLTYEDQDGDLMLVGDVPWTLFIGSVKRLRIMKRSEAACIPPRNSPKLWKGGAT